MLEGKNIEEGFGIAFRVLQVWEKLDVTSTIITEVTPASINCLSKRPFLQNFF